MSGRRSRSRNDVSEEEISELISKLQSLLPETRRRRGTSRSASSAAGLLKETCNYIKALHREVDDLSDRLSEMMTAMDFDSTQAELLRSLFR